MILENKADVCLILEGTFPYFTGGVATWTYDLIRAQKDLTFHLVCLLPRRAKLSPKYDIPSNVLSITNIHLQELPKGPCGLNSSERKVFLQEMESLTLNLLHARRLNDFKTMISLFRRYQGRITEETLLNSPEAWQMIVRIYLSLLGDTSFINYFWSYRSLMGGLYSILLADIPPAAVYHSICTGFAGMFMARAVLETGNSGLITEHGIYTNERRIEIASAAWLEDTKVMNLSIETNRFEKDLKDYWIDTFVCYSRLCYEAADRIITLYEGNVALQIADGAPPEKCMVIPNGIDVRRFAAIPRHSGHPPTIALIGRVVPIKDVKTFIHAINQLRNEIPDVRAWIIGPTDEDPEYVDECRELTVHNALEKTISFLGKVDVAKYLGEIDIVALTSISEAQPLVLLEGGALGIPCVTTNTGSCPELVFGRCNEEPKLGEAGAVCHLANPYEIGKTLAALLSNPVRYAACSKTIKERVQRYYREEQQEKAYRDLYHSLLKEAAWQA